MATCTAATGQQFNFLTGTGGVPTTPQALGSGVLDFSGKYVLFRSKIRPVGDNGATFFAPSLKITKYRPQDNLSLKMEDGKAVLYDNTAGRTYDNSFFSYDGSKLVTGWIHVPIYFLFLVGDNDEEGVFVAPWYDRYCFAYYKEKYEVGGKEIKDKIRNSEMKKFPFSKDKVGIDFGYLMENGLIFYASYSFTPMFRPGMGPRINEASIGIGIPYNRLYQH